MRILSKHENWEKIIFKKQKEWREWLYKNHNNEKELWIVYFRKSANKKAISYSEALEEALCYGWIDGIVKNINEESYCQRFTPRRKNSNLSETNKELIRRLITGAKMTKFGLKAVEHAFDKSKKIDKLKQDPLIWKNFNGFSEAYKRVRINWIEDYRRDSKIFERRLNYFLKKTSRNKKYGRIQ